MFWEKIKELYRLMFIERPLTPKQIDAIIFRAIIMYKEKPHG